MVDGRFVMSRGGPANRIPGWRNSKGAAVTGDNYVEGGKSRSMSTAEVEDVKKRRGRRAQTAIESETMGAG